MSTNLSLPTLVRLNISLDLLEPISETANDERLPLSSWYMPKLRELVVKNYFPNLPQVPLTYLAFTLKCDQHSEVYLERLLHILNPLRSLVTLKLTMESFGNAYTLPNKSRIIDLPYVETFSLDTKFIHEQPLGEFLGLLSTPSLKSFTLNVQLSGHPAEGVSRHNFLADCLPDPRNHRFIRQVTSKLKISGMDIIGWYDMQLLHLPTFHKYFPAIHSD